jgi:hypothetical protein
MQDRRPKPAIAGRHDNRTFSLLVHGAAIECGSPALLLYPIRAGLGNFRHRPFNAMASGLASADLSHGKPARNPPRKVT